jgi:hypothetical protein
MRTRPLAGDRVSLEVTAVRARQEKDKRDMSSDTPSRPVEQVVVKFPHTDEERNRRIMADVTELANLAPGEWKLWYHTRAKLHGMTSAQFAELIEAQIKDREQKAKEALAKERLEEDRAKRLRLSERDRQREQKRIEDKAKSKAKEKSKAFADIIKLPSDQHEAKLDDLAKRLEEDVAALRAEFAEYCAAETPTCSAEPSEWDIEAWPEPVTTVVVLEELIARINQHVKAKPHEVLAIVLWVMMCWVHEAAAHWSVYLVATSPKEDCGKTTLIIEVVGRLTPKS